MTTKTFIPGKLSPLEDSIAKMQQTLQNLGFQIQSNPVLNPVENIFSQHIYDVRCPGIFTNGKGACALSCYASALGEFLERLSTNYFFSDYYLQPAGNELSVHDWLYYPDEKIFNVDNFKQMLTPELWAFYQQSFEHSDDSVLDFTDFLSFNDDQELVRAIPLESVKTGETVYFPMNLLSNLYASNGLSAGNTALEAQIQGLSEVFERWVKNKIFRENICLPEIPQNILNQFPGVVQAIEALEAQGLRVNVRDASLGGVYPVVNVTLIVPNEGTCFASFGAHPLFEVALERTLTESLQGRHLQNLDGFQMPVHDADAVAEDENLENHFIDSSGLIHQNFLSDRFDYAFTLWAFPESMEAQWQLLCELVWQQGTDVFVGHYQQFGFEAIRLVVPGMSEVYPLYELVENNQNRGRELRAKIIKLNQQLDEQAIEETLAMIDELGLSDHQGVASLIGLMPDKHSFWGQMTVSQLRFWCFYGLQEWEEAYQQAQEVVYFLHDDNPQKTWFKAFNFFAEQLALAGALKEFSIEAIDVSSFQLLFSKAVADSVLACVERVELKRQDLGMEIFTNSRSHQMLLEIYMGLRDAKKVMVLNR